MRKNSGVRIAALTPIGAIKNDYFRWLCKGIILDIDSMKRVKNRSSYRILARMLFNKEFYWTVPNDDNRLQDGKNLRERYAEKTNYKPYDALDGPCTVLEMLIALAERFEQSVSNPGKHGHETEWFWMMLSNLKISRQDFTDAEYCRYWDDCTVDTILETWLDRTYDYDGWGGLFPLKEPKKDQRKVEIWYQMCAYLLENYYV